MGERRRDDDRMKEPRPHMGKNLQLSSFSHSLFFPLLIRNNIFFLFVAHAPLPLMLFVIPCG